MNPACDILITKIPAKNLKIDFQIPISFSSFDPPTAKAIYNAWMETAIIDNHGMIWIRFDSMSQILRTSKSNAKHIIAKVRDEHKRESADGVYLRYSEVSRLLSDIIQTACAISREKYAGYSESIGLAIRDSAEAKNLRAQSYESIAKARRHLKQKRIQWLSIKHDELTGFPLSSHSQFSHIRSCAVYPQFTTCLWNGLIVDRGIHQIITSSSVNDEHELIDLCLDRKWSTHWHDGFSKEIA
jgi:hypothetical protein